MGAKLGVKTLEIILTQYSTKQDPRNDSYQHFSPNVYIQETVWLPSPKKSLWFQFGEGRLCGVGGQLLTLGPIGTSDSRGYGNRL